MNITEQDYDEIIAIMVDNVVYLGQSAIDKALEIKKIDKTFSRAVFKLMAEFDLSPKWKEYSNCPRLFTMTEYNSFCNKNV